MKNFTEFITQITNEYFYIMYIDLGFRGDIKQMENDDVFYEVILRIKEMNSSNPQESPDTFTLFEDVYSESEAKGIVANFFRNISITILEYLKYDIYEKFNLSTLKVKTLRSRYSKNRLSMDDSIRLMSKYKDDKVNITEKLKGKLKTKRNFLVGEKHYEEMNIYDILNEKLRFRSSMSYIDMIVEWENKCREMNCNYLSIEYPEFAKKGGYQMAINAKPLFINHALNLCRDYAVVYIDGDMFIEKYPGIFDIKNVDYMARG